MNKFGYKIARGFVFALSGYLLLVIILLFLLPSSMQPGATQLAYCLLVVLFWLIFCWNLMKKCRKSEPLVTSVEPPVNQINSIETIENTYDRHQTNDSQISLTTSETSLPPKYEMPPSYSQAVSTLRLNYWKTDSSKSMKKSKVELGPTFRLSHEEKRTSIMKTQLSLSFSAQIVLAEFILTMLT